MFQKIKKYINIGHRLPLAVALCLIVALLSANNLNFEYLEYDYILSEGMQNPLKPVPVQATPQNPKNPNAANKKVVTLIKAVSTSKQPEFDYQLVKDSVVFFHDGAHLYCDSAHYRDYDNTFEAFSRVRMEQGDTLFLYGNYMHYDGNTKLVKVRGNVRLEHIPRNVTLFTDSLNYDRAMNIGYYFDGGMLVDTLNELTSYWGQYQPSLNLATFLDSVILTNPKFILYSDTLRYNTQTSVATITSPTEIVSDSGIVYTSRGWYNTKTDQSLLLDQSSIVNKEGNRILKGDSIFYDRANGKGEVFGNMFMQDTAKRVILKGDYGYYNDKTDYAFATKMASAIDYSQGDTLYLHADTLKLITDSIFREIKAYHGVRFFRSDMQGVCDSMQFHSRDSILHLYRDPVLWSDGNQLYGDTIDIFMNDSTIDFVHVKKYSFSIEQKDSTHFNQLKGRSMKVYFDNKQVRRVLVEGNAESIYYPEEERKSKDEKPTYIGLNKLGSSYIEIFLKNQQLEKLKAWPKVEGKMTPVFLVKPEQRKLEDFYWYDYLRPVDKDDIFRKVSRKKEDVKPKRKTFSSTETASSTVNKIDIPQENE